ncbi:MAG: hypothetical protein AMXMBFR20_27500 [Planctomycetia bacterium]
MVIAHHIILTGYGHWLPNDPRGSLSRQIRVPQLRQAGDIHFGRKATQPALSELRRHQIDARSYLKHKVLWFDLAERQAIATAFTDVVASREYTCLACAILSNHAHLVMRRHQDRAEVMMTALIEASAVSVRNVAGSFQNHPVWSQDKYKRFLSSADEVCGVIKYVEDNPGKSGLPRQEYTFVKPYRGEWSERR